jgi:hypothetical protein
MAILDKIETASLSIQKVDVTLSGTKSHVTIMTKRMEEKGRGY